MKIRINRYISMCGYTSRRKADELIQKGFVFINDRRINGPGVVVDIEKDKVRIGEEELYFEEKRYVLLNKPKLYLTSLGNNQDDRKTIEELISDIPERLYPVGRLDYDVEGLLFLTNDGEMAHKLHHPSYEVPKQYLCVLTTKMTISGLEKLKKGANLEDGFVVPDNVKLSGKNQDKSVVVITFHEGKNRLVKRYFKFFGFKIIKLKRVAIGPLMLGDLKKGEWRDLTRKELLALTSYFS